MISDLSASNFKEKERLAVAKPKTGDLHRLFIALEEFATTSQDREWRTTPRVY